MKTYKVVILGLQNDEIVVNATGVALNSYGVYEFFSGNDLVASFPIKGVLGVIELNALGS